MTLLNEAPVNGSTVTVSTRATTLVEIMISTLILAVITTSVVAAMGSLAELGNLNTKSSDLGWEGQNLMREIGEEISRTGWFFPSFDADVYATTNGAEDRDLIYFPYVVQQAPGDVSETEAWGNGLPADIEFKYNDTQAPAEKYNLRFVVRPPGMSRVATPELLPGEVGDFDKVFSEDATATDADYYRSFHARSQEFLFLKSRSGEWTSDPNLSFSEAFDFSGPSAKWQTPDPDDVMVDVNALIDGGDSPKDAHRKVRDNEGSDYGHFYHDDIGVLRMTEFWPRFKREGGDDDDKEKDVLISTETGEPELLAWDRGSSVDSDKRFIQMPESPGAWIARTPDGLFDVRVNWEAMVPDDQIRLVTDDNGSGETIIEIDQLRVYSYAVIPSPIEGSVGRLVRCYSVDFDVEEDSTPLYQDNGQGVEVGQWISKDPTSNRAMIIDKVLSDNVARVVFDTWRTDTRTEAEGRLGRNEVRIRLYMATYVTHEDEGEKLVRYISEGTFTMRTSNNAKANRRHADLLSSVRTEFRR